MDTTNKHLVSISEARQLLGDIGHTTLYALVNRGEIVKVNIGRRGLITTESLEAYVDRLTAPHGRGSGEQDPTGHPTETDELGEHHPEASTA